MIHGCSKSYECREKIIFKVVPNPVTMHRIKNWRNGVIWNVAIENWISSTSFHPEENETS